MALRALVDKETFDQLPDVLQREYVLREEGPFEGTYFLDVTQTSAKDVDGKETIFALEDVKGLKSSLQKERGEVAKLTKQLKDFDGIEDAASAKAAIAKLKEIGDNPDASEQLKAATESLKKQLEEKHGIALKSVTDERDVLESQLGQVLVDNKVLDALSKHKLVEGGAELIMPHIKQRVKVAKVDGKLVAQVIDPSTGLPAISMKQGDDGPMGIEEYVASLAENRVTKLAFAGKGKSGSADPKEKSGGNPDNPSQQKPDDSGFRRDGIHTTTSNDPADKLMAAREQASG